MNREPLHLQHIDITRSGPLDNLQLDPGPLTVVYGRNESGKSTLLEKTVQALFMRGKKLPAAFPQGRYAAGNCSVTVSVDGRPVVFAGRDRSLPEIAAGLGLPEELFPLLLVHSGECALPEERLTVRTLAELLFSREELGLRLMEKVTGKSGAYLEWDGPRLHFNSAKTKEIRQYETREKALQQAFLLRDQFFELVSERELVEAERVLAQVQADLAEQTRAAQWQAGVYRRELAEKQRVLRLMEEGGVEELSQQLPEMLQVQAGREQLEQLSLRKETDRQNRLWLHNTVTALESGGRPGGRNWLRVAAVLSGAVSAVAAFFVPAVSASAALGALLCWLLWSAGRSGRQDAQRREVQRIKEEFRSRFGVPFASVTDCRTRIELLQEQAGRLEGEIERMERDRRRYEEFTNRVALFRRAFPGELPEDVADAVQAARCERETVRDRISRLEVLLAGLPGDGAPLPATPPQVVYDPDQVRRLQQEETRLQSEIASGRERLRPVRDTLVGMTGMSSDLLQDSSGIATALEEHISQLQHEQHRFLVEAAADSLLGRYLEHSRSCKTEPVRRVLQEGRLMPLFNRFTGKTRTLLLDDDEICFESGNGVEPLGGLSKGAQDQFMLALRIALLDHLTEGRPLFLLLDDAFQHTDWERRRVLVENTVSLVKEEGWQVVYFTMDDHLRECFLSADPHCTAVDLE